MDSTCINDPMMSTLLAGNFLHLDSSTNTANSVTNQQALLTPTQPQTTYNYNLNTQNQTE